MAQQFQDFRNYDKEAQELIKDLRKGDLHGLYELVCTQLSRPCTETRVKELRAVQAAIEKVPGLDVPRLKSAKFGPRSEMAQGARATDGNTRPNRKKV